MKRLLTMEKYDYNTALKKANLVERNVCPNGTTILNPLRVSMHDEQDIISLAQQIQQADQMVKNSACGKLGVILEQIRALQAQAKKILEETERNNILNNAACNFTKKPGNIYHLYQRESGQSYFSMLSPEEWNGACKHKFLGSFRLETDMTWTPTEKILERDEMFAITEKILNADKEKSLAIEYFH